MSTYRHEYDFVRPGPPRMAHEAYFQNPANHLMQMVSGPTRESQRSYPMARPARQGSARRYEENDEQPRRRIAVACARCRRRKIRCTGDEGDGCNACKLAGAGPCNFFRVGSHELGSHELGGMLENARPGSSSTVISPLIVGSCPSFSSNSLLSSSARAHGSASSQKGLQETPSPQIARVSVPQDWSSVAYQHQVPVEFYTSPCFVPAPTVVSGDYQQHQHNPDMDRSWTPNLSERPTVSAAYYGHDAIAASGCPPATIAMAVPYPAMGQSAIGHYNQSRVYYRAPPVPSSRVLPVPPMLRLQYSAPANLNEMTTRTSAMSLNHTGYLSQRSLPWHNDRPPGSPSPASSVDSEPNDDTRLLTGPSSDNGAESTYSPAAARSGYEAPITPAVSSSLIAYYPVGAEYSPVTAVGSSSGSIHSTDSNDTAVEESAADVSALNELANQAAASSYTESHQESFGDYQISAAGIMTIKKES